MKKFLLMAALLFSVSGALACIDKALSDEDSFAKCMIDATTGDATAQANLGMMYLKGDGVLQDYGEAASWTRKAAKQGLAVAQYNLGVAYTNGEGVEQDHKEAVQWYRKAAKQGLAGAQFNLGVKYFMGEEGVAQNQKESLKWFGKAAEQGNTNAQYNLGVMHFKGAGVVENYVMAHVWLYISGNNGNENASKIRYYVASKMTPLQIQEAHMLAKEWMAEHP